MNTADADVSKFPRNHLFPVYFMTDYLCTKFQFVEIWVAGKNEPPPPSLYTDPKKPDLNRANFLRAENRENAVFAT